MLYSMTGFGKANGEYNSKSYSVEIKTLNGKTSDIRLKIPLVLRNRELELRSLIMDQIVRGKVDVVISLSGFEGDVDYKLNLNLMGKYLEELAGFASEYGLSHQDFIQSIIRIPNVVQANEELISDPEWNFVKSLTLDGLKHLDEFRKKEGEALALDIIRRIKNIESELLGIQKNESARSEELKQKLNRLINDNIAGDGRVDQNRLEQEIVYYLEKLDIHEEKVRLQQHCSYFLKILEDQTKDPGKKLGFLTQEIGREINTIGSKAQFSEIQRSVVRMKVELDQIKEQLANVL